MRSLIQRRSGASCVALSLRGSPCLRPRVREARALWPASLGRFCHRCAAVELTPQASAAWVRLRPLRSAATHLRQINGWASCVPRCLVSITLFNPSATHLLSLLYLPG